MLRVQNWNCQYHSDTKPNPQSSWEVLWEIFEEGKGVDWFFGGFFLLFYDRILPFSLDERVQNLYVFPLAMGN